eukprot:IDg6293t1
MLLQNAQNCKRAVYLSGEELTIVPRHWQRGYVKLKSIKTETDRKCASEIAQEEELRSTYETTLVKQSAVLQGGRTARSVREIYGVLNKPQEFLHARIEIFRKSSVEWQRDIRIKNR